MHVNKLDFIVKCYHFLLQTLETCIRCSLMSPKEWSLPKWYLIYVTFECLPKENKANWTVLTSQTSSCSWQWTSDCKHRWHVFMHHHYSYQKLLHASCIDAAVLFLNDYWVFVFSLYWFVSGALVYVMLNDNLCWQEACEFRPFISALRLGVW